MDYRIVRGFFSPLERSVLCQMGSWVQWLPGRQGTGYERASVRFPTIEEKCLSELGVAPEVGHDAYLLRYPTGSFIPLHRDEALFGQKHLRINVLLQQSSEGGELYLDGEYIEIEELDALVFRPDLILHEVRPVTKGQRLLWTVGVLV